MVIENGPISSMKANKLLILSATHLLTEASFLLQFIHNSITKEEGFKRLPKCLFRLRTLLAYLPSPSTSLNNTQRKKPHGFSCYGVK